MNGFDGRGDAYENKFVHDETLKFKVEARRNKLLGLWAARKMGKNSNQAEKYARQVINSDFEEPGDEDVFRKIRKDFEAAGVEQSDRQIRHSMDELMGEALRQIESES